MRRADLGLYKCKLRLLQFGLLDEAKYIDDISAKTKNIPDVEPVDSEDDSADTAHMEKVILMREKYTEQAIRKHKLATADIRKGKHEGASEARREVIKAFLKDMVKNRICQTCKGISPNYRKDRFVKIFEKSLSAKDAAKMAQGHFKIEDALTIRIKEKNATKKKVHETDEGVADVDSSPDEDDVGLEEEAEDEEDEGSGEDLDENGDVVMTDAAPKSKISGKKVAPPQRYVTSIEVLARLSLLFEKEQEMISLLYNSRPQTKLSKPITADSFFLQVILVPPNKYRPEARQGDGGIAEAQENSLYKMILSASTKVAQIHRELANRHNPDEDTRPRRRDISELHEACVALQDCVNSMIDKDRNPIRGAAGKRNEDGIKQKLEKKEGLFRKNMM
jgi:DNA-directed RNA polymerase I subunit RPA1